MDINDRLSRHLRNLYQEELGLKDTEERIQARLNSVRGKAVVGKLSKRIDLKGKKVLEVGSGWGEILLEAALCGAETFGVEPDQETLNLARERAREQNASIRFYEGRGENLPFPDQTFDLIICHSVLEHVQDVSAVISEMARVLSPGGLVYLEVPNYLFPYEAHYKIYYPPLFPKKWVKAYLRLRGRKPDFFDSIQYITPRLLRMKMAKNRLQMKPFHEVPPTRIRRILDFLDLTPQLEYFLSHEPAQSRKGSTEVCES